MNRGLRFLLTLLMSLVTLCSAAITPQQVMQSVTQKINAGGVSGKFVSGNVSGSFKFDGRRSYVELQNGAKSWFDGRNMWTLNPSAREVTLVYPESDELRDANPMLYLRDYSNNYRLFFSKRKETGRHLILLNPKSGKDMIKAVEVAVNSSTMLPERFIVRDRQDKVTTVIVKGLRTGMRFNASDFTFPQKKYNNYELIDLR